MLFWLEVWARQNWDKHLRVTPRQVRTGIQNNVWTRFALLLLEPRSSSPHWEHRQPSLQNCLHTGEGIGQGQVKMPQTFHFQVAFFSFQHFLGRCKLWLFSGVLTKLVLRVSACFLVFLWGNKSLQLPTPSFCWHHSPAIFLTVILFLPLYYCGLRNGVILTKSTLTKSLNWRMTPSFCRVS